MNEHNANRQGNFSQEEQFVLMSKEINRYLLRFHDKYLENEYFQHSLYKYKELGYTICIIHVIIIIADFVDLFESSVYPQKKLIHLVVMLAAAIIMFIFLHFKEHCFNVAYSIYYCVYITLNGWYMYDSDLNQDDFTSGSGSSFTRGYTISAILVLGITGSNYVLKNMLFLYGTILIFIAQGIQQGAEFEIIIRAILILSLYFYVSHHREYAHRRSYLRQKQIDQYNNIMNNQIPHCLFAAKFNSAEQRIELFKCNSRAQKEFGINGNEDFDRFITNTFMVSQSSSDDRLDSKIEQQFVGSFNDNNNNHSSQPNHPCKSTSEQTWENSLKGQIRQLIDQRIPQNHEITEPAAANSLKSPTSNKPNSSSPGNQNHRSPILKLKLRMQQGVDTENKISVQLSLFKLHEYYIIITVDKWKKSEKKNRKHKLDCSPGKITKHQKDHVNETTKRETYQNKNIQNCDNYCFTPNRNKYTSDTNQQLLRQEQVEDIENRQLNTNINTTSSRQNSNPSPPQNMLPTYPGAQTEGEEEQQALFNLNQNGGILRTHATTTIHTRSSMSGGQDTPRLISSLTQAGISSQASIPLATPSTAASQPNYTFFKPRQQHNYHQYPAQSNNTQFSYLMSKKLSLSSARKQAGSVYSLGSTNIHQESTNQTRTTSIGCENNSPRIFQHLLLQQNQRNSHSTNIPNLHYNELSKTKISAATATATTTTTNSIQKDPMITAACFATIQQTIKLIKRYKENWQLFRDGLVNKNLLAVGVDHIEQYTASMMQEILIVNSNFIRLNVLQYNALQLQFSTFKLTSLCAYLQQHLQPLLLDRNISLYLQDNKELDECQIFSDEFALRISLVNIISYISEKIPQNSFVSVKFSFDSDSSDNNNNQGSNNNNLKIQISSAFYEDSAFKDFDSLLCLLGMDNSKVLQRFNVDLKVALNLLKIINNNNPKTKEYLRLSVPPNKQQHMHLSIFIPRQDYCEEKQQIEQELSNQEQQEGVIAKEQKQTPQLKSINLTRDDADGLNSIGKHTSNADAKILLTSEVDSQTERDFVTSSDNNNINLTDCSFSSLDKWIAFKQYTSRIADKPIKLIL